MSPARNTVSPSATSTAQPPHPSRAALSWTKIPPMMGVNVHDHDFGHRDHAGQADPRTHCRAIQHQRSRRRRETPAGTGTAHLSAPCLNRLLTSAKLVRKSVDAVGCFRWRGRVRRGDLRSDPGRQPASLRTPIPLSAMQNAAHRGPGKRTSCLCNVPQPGVPGEPVTTNPSAKRIPQKAHSASDSD